MSKSKKKVVGGTGITAGGDVSIDDVSGQVAIGEKIIQIINKDGSKSWLYTNGIRPATDPANIFGRQRELEEIDRRFKQSTALAITGFRGTGKSTLASMYFDRIEKRGEYAGIYWRRVNETLEIGDVVGSFFMAIGKPVDLGRYKQDEDKLALLFRELKAAPYFLVLDNFEIILDPQTNTPLKLKQGFSDLIENAKDNAGRSRFLFTSWECPASERGIRPEFYCIGGLDESAAIQLLRKKGLTEPDDELKTAVALSGGHPLALILLVQLVKEGAETLSSILKDDTLWKGEVAKNILDKVYKERLSEEERKLLQYVSLYREPVPLKAIIATANGQWSEALVKKIALILNRKSLLQKTGDNYWEESLIHSYAYSKLADKVERHNLACQYYLTIVSENPASEDVVQSLIEACYHACMAKEYDTAAIIIFDSGLIEDLDKWGNYRTLIDLYSGMLPKDHFEDKPLMSNINIHTIILGKLGNTYVSLGDVRKAIVYYEKALKIAQEIEDKQGEGVVLGNLGTAYSALGDAKKAIVYHEKALRIDQEIGDRGNKGISLGNLGNAYNALGDAKKAIVYYEKALRIAQEIGDKPGEGAVLGNLGTAYHDLGDNAKKAIEYYEKALRIAQEIGNKKGAGTYLGNLGGTYRDLGDTKKAIEYCEKALRIAQEIGDRKNEGAWLGNLGSAYSDLGQVEKAIQCYEKALAIAVEIGDRRGEGNAIGNLGNAYSHIGQVEHAIQYYEKALVIDKEIGDRRGEGTDLGNLGNAYSDLGQVEHAIQYYEKALAIAQEIGDRRGEGNHLGNLGGAYYSLGQVDKAIQHYEKALAIAQEIGDRKGEGNHLGNLGLAYSDLGQVDKAIQYHEKALACLLLARDIRTQIKDPYLEQTEANLNDLKEKLGEKEFEKLAAETAPRAEEIVRKILGRA